MVVNAVESWLTASLKESPTRSWLTNYLTADLFNVYQAFNKLDGIFAVYAFFCFDEKGYADWLGAFESLVAVCGHTLAPADPKDKASGFDGALRAFRGSVEKNVQFQVQILLCTGNSERAKKNAAGALRILARDNADDRKAIAQAGGIPPLVELVRTGASAEAKKQAAGALRALAFDDDLEQRIEMLGYTFKS